MIRKNSLILFSTLALLALSNLSHAGIEYCSKTAVHCAYISGLSDDPNDGRYIKLENNKVTLVGCLNNYSTAIIEEIGAKQFLGNNSDRYSICEDAEGRKCNEIGVDNFSVDKNKDEYVGKPQFFNVNLSNLKDNYPACNGLSS